MIVPLHVVDTESMNNAAVEDQSAMEETLVVSTVGQSNNENLRMETDDAIINGDINIPDLNAEVDWRK